MVQGLQWPVDAQHNGNKGAWWSGKHTHIHLYTHTHTYTYIYSVCDPLCEIQAKNLIMR